jgi:hypothetical protein
MPFGQMRTEFVEGAGAMVEGKVVEGTVVDGTVVEGTTVVDGNTVLDGEMLGAEPAMLLPELALSPRPGAGPTVLPGAGPTVLPGAGPTVLPSWLGGVPVMLGMGVPTAPGVAPTAPGVAAAAPGVVAAAPGVVAAAPGAAPAPGAPTWASAGNAARVAASRSGKRSRSSMGEISFLNELSMDKHARFVPTKRVRMPPSP